MAVRDGDRAAQQERLEALAQARRAPSACGSTLKGEEPVEAGRREASRGAARSRVRRRRRRPRRDAGPRRSRRAEDFADLLARRHGPRGRAHARAATLLAGTVEGARPDDLPRTRRGRDRRRRATASRASTRPASTRATIGVRVLVPEDELEDAVSENTLGIFLILLAFLVCALRLRAHRRALAAGADRPPARGGASSIGSGDFSVEVPTEGNDEFAALGNEFNSMARQLEARLEELAARARAAAGGGPARRRVDRHGPGPRRAARHRRPDRGRRRRRRLRPGGDAPRRRTGR